MKTLRLLATLAVLLAGQISRAQLDVILTMPFTTLLQTESIPAIVTIRNNTGSAIPVGGPDGYALLFDIKDANGQAVLAREGRNPVAASIPAGGTLILTNDLLSCYQLLDQRQANVIAAVDYLGRSFISKKEYLDLQEGAELARLRINTGGHTLVHTLRILQRTRHEHLFLRVDDETAGTTYGASDLGTYLRSSPPQFMSDRGNNTHILHRSGPEEFSYHVAAPDGSFTKHERFSGDYKLVRLITNPDGTITCNGLPADKGDRPQILQQTPFRPDLHRGESGKKR